MKRWLLAASCLTPFLYAEDAKAQLVGGSFGGTGTIICENCYDQVTGIASDVLTAANWVTQLAHMVTTITQIITVWQMLSGLTSVNQMAVILNSAAYFNAMNSFGNVPQMIQGGGFGNLGGLGGSYLSANTYFMPTVGSPMPMLNQTANLLTLRSNSLASVQAITAQSLATATAILAGLMALQQLIDLQPSNQFMAGLASRLHSYQGNIASQQWQLQQMQTFAAAQARVFEEQQRQANYCSAVMWSNSTTSISGVGLTIGGSGPCLSNGITSANPVVAVAATVGSAASLIGGIAGLVGGIGGSSGAVDTGTFDVGSSDSSLPTPPIPPAGGASGASTADSSLPTPPIPPTDTGADFDQTVTPSDNADIAQTTNNSCTSAAGADCTIPAQSAADLGCVETSDGGDCGGLTYDDTATFDPTAVPSAIPPVGAVGTGGAITIQPGGDPSNVFQKDGPPTVMNSIPPPAALSGMAMVALLKPRRRGLA